jgi:aspartate ammonia-lyase
MLTHSQTINLLKKADLFQGLSTDDLTRIANESTLKTFEPNDILFRENSPRRQMFIVFHGRVMLYKTNAFGKEQIITYFNKGDFFGEGSLMEDSPHSTSARATEKTTVVVIEGDLLRKYGSIAVVVLSNITRVVSRRMRYANAKGINSTAQYESGKTRKNTICLAIAMSPMNIIMAFRPCEHSKTSILAA